MALVLLHAMVEILYTLIENVQFSVVEKLNHKKLHGQLLEEDLTKKLNKMKLTRKKEKDKLKYNALLKVLL